MRRIRSNRVKSRAVAATALAVALAFGVPAGAAAQNITPGDTNPTDEQYDDGVLGFSAAGDPQDPADPAPVSGGDVDELPFTGLDVAAIAAIGIGLAGGGFAIRRAARISDTA